MQYRRFFVGSMSGSFNEAAAEEPRKSLRPAGLPGPSARFNEAAAEEPRK